MDAKDKLKIHENNLKLKNALNQIRNRQTRALDNDHTFVDNQGVTHSTIDRVVSSVEQPIQSVPSNEELFSLNGNKPNYKLLINHFKHQGKLKEEQVIKIIKMATSLFEVEPNILRIKSPVTVCGDVHGQLFDLFKLFEISGDPSETSYLFLGDYVDRGNYSLEVLLILYAMKINYPATFSLLRGNHETAQMTSHFTFKSECLRKYSRSVYKCSLKSFSALPIVAIMNNQFFCVHGGISKEIKYLSDIDSINRFVIDFPSSGAYCDLMWSDPITDYDNELKPTRRDFVENYERGCSFMYNYNAVTKFLERNKLLSVIRAHQAQDKGYRMYASTSQSFPSIISLFSAPNYCGTYGNKAAVLKYDTSTMNIRQFSSQAEPYHLPNEMNVFTWSVPFVAERVCEILLAVLNICSDEELEEPNSISRDLVKSIYETEPELISKLDKVSESSDEIMNDEKDGFDITSQFDRNALRKKILAIGRISRMFQLLRQESEKVEQLRNLSGGLNLPKGVLLDGSDELNRQLTHFERVRLADLSNEGLPPSMQKQRELEMKEFNLLKEKANSSLP